MRKDMRNLVKKAIKRGWVDVTEDGTKHRAKHFRLEWVNGARITVSKTPSDVHALKNARNDMRRAEQNPLT